MIFGTFVLITVMLIYYIWINNDILITHKKYYPVNEISHNMIVQPTTSNFILKSIYQSFLSIYIP